MIECVAADNSHPAAPPVKREEPVWARVAYAAAGVATGVGMVGASIAGMAYEAAGDDAVAVFDTDGSEDLPSPTGTPGLDKLDLSVPIGR